MKNIENAVEVHLWAEMTPWEVLETINELLKKSGTNLQIEFNEDSESAFFISNTNE